MLTKLKELASEVYFGEAIGEDFTHDELSAVRVRPRALVRAHSAEEVASVMKFANENKLPVTPRGAGTGLVGGAVPSAEGILLDLSPMNRILEIDRENLTMSVEPGVLLMEAAKAAEECGLFYPPDPGEKTATIGGNISTNAGGMRAVKYGVTRDFVRGLEVILPNGERLSLGGKVVKNSSGYSLKDLFVGSEGTLGVIVGATLRLLPLPRTKVSLLVPFGNLERALGALPRLLASTPAPTAVEFMEREVILAAEEFLARSFPDHSADSYLLLTYDGATKSEIEFAADSAAELCLECGAEDVLLSNSPEREQAIWAARGAFLEAIKASTTEMDECDVVVPRAQIARFIGFAKELRARHGLRIRYFGHAGDGNLHIYILRDALSRGDWEVALAKVFSELYAEAQNLGGKVSGEHGIGLAKREHFANLSSDVERNLLKGIKAVFDPNGIMNPGKVI